MNTTEFPFYNLFIGIGLIFAVLLLENDFRRKGDYKHFPAFLITLVIAFTAGWFAGHLFDYLLRGYFPLRVPLSRHGEYGFSITGGLLGGGLILLPLLLQQKYNLPSSLDRIAPLIPLIQGFGRLGCAIKGCCFGKIINLGGWEFRFPVQLISALFLFSLFIILTKVKFRINRTYIYTWAYCIGRFALEFLRGDFRGWLLFKPLSPAQELSLYLITASTLVFYINKFLRHKND